MLFDFVKLLGIRQQMPMSKNIYGILKRKFNFLFPCCIDTVQKYSKICKTFALLLIKPSHNNFIKISNMYKLNFIETFEQTTKTIYAFLGISLQ